jgi:hypothetical protein
MDGKSKKSKQNKYKNIGSVRVRKLKEKLSISSKKS